MKIVFGKDKELEEAIKQGVMKEFENFLLRKLLEQTMEKLGERTREENIVARKDNEILALNYELEKLRKYVTDTEKTCVCAETTPKKRGRKAGSKNGTTKK